MADDFVEIPKPEDIQFGLSPQGATGKVNPNPTLPEELGTKFLPPALLAILDLAQPEMGPLASAAYGAGSGALGSILGQEASGQPIDKTRTAIDTGLGAILGPLNIGLRKGAKALPKTSYTAALEPNSKSVSLLDAAASAGLANNVGMNRPGLQKASNVVQDLEQKITDRQALLDTIEKLQGKAKASPNQGRRMSLPSELQFLNPGGKSIQAKDVVATTTPIADKAKQEIDILNSHHDIWDNLRDTVDKTIRNKIDAPEHVAVYPGGLLPFNQGKEFLGARVSVPPKYIQKAKANLGLATKGLATNSPQAEALRRVLGTLPPTAARAVMAQLFGVDTEEPQGEVPTTP